jgi:hypothetical protein
MKKITYIFLLYSSFFFNGSFAQNNQNAQDIFKENIAVFEKLANGEDANLNSIYEARGFLIRVTGISYEMEKSFDMPILPPQETLNEWKTWFEKNKECLYWHKRKKEIRVKNK